MALVGLDEIRSGIDQELSNFVSARTRHLSAIDSHLSPIADALSDYILSGGKRFRPIFAQLGYLGAGGTNQPEIIRACSSLELVHACALIHDDLMDGSDSRRNQPSIHKRFESLHVESKYSGSAIRFGSSAAILLGDLALSWSDWMLNSAGLDGSTLSRSIPVFQEMREELMAGQYLDVLEGAIADSNLERSMKIANLKSGKYSIERPLHFGAALADASGALIDTYSRFGLPLGQAFQLRDDILGVFGDWKITGKPSGDDIREGKRTVLVAMALQRIDGAAKKELEAALGNLELGEAQISNIQEIIRASGALRACESLIDELLTTAMHALEMGELEPNTKKTLEEMAILATKRSS